MSTTELTTTDKAVLANMKEIFETSEPAEVKNSIFHVVFEVAHTLCEHEDGHTSNPELMDSLFDLKLIYLFMDSVQKTIDYEPKPQLS